MSDRACEHLMIFLGTGEGFQNGWFCPDCEQHLHLSTEEHHRRGVVFASINLSLLRRWAHERPVQQPHRLL